MTINFTTQEQIFRHHTHLLFSKSDISNRVLFRLRNSRCAYFHPEAALTERDGQRKLWSEIKIVKFEYSEGENIQFARREYSVRKERSHIYLFLIFKPICDVSKLFSSRKILGYWYSKNL